MKFLTLLLSIFILHIASAADVVPHGVARGVGIWNTQLHHLLADGRTPLKEILEEKEKLLKDELFYEHMLTNNGFGYTPLMCLLFNPSKGAATKSLEIIGKLFEGLTAEQKKSIIEVPATTLVFYKGKTVLDMAKDMKYICPSSCTSIETYLQQQLEEYAQEQHEVPSMLEMVNWTSALCDDE